MGCNHRKDLTRMVATARMSVNVDMTRRRIISPNAVNDGRKRRFVDVYLWQDQEALYANVHDSTPEGGAACMQPMPSFWDIHPLLAWSAWLDLKLFNFVHRRLGTIVTECLGWPRNFTSRKVGELHFIRGIWSKYVVSHECLHLTILLARDTGALDEIMRDVRGPGYYEISPEEDFCTMHQSLFVDVYGFLREHDQDGELHK